MKSPDRWLQRLLDSNYGLLWIGLLSVGETLLIPIPIELIMVPYMIARPQRLWLIATATLVGCVLASIMGYLVGLLLFESVGQWLLTTLGAESAFDSFQQRFAEDGFLAILAIGITPIPFQVALLAAGIAAYSFPLFLAAVLIARGVRYYGLALLVYFFGQRALGLWKRHRMAAGLAALAIFGVIFGLLQWLGR